MAFCCHVWFKYNCTFLTLFRWQKTIDDIPWTCKAFSVSVQRILRRKIWQDHQHLGQCQMRFVRCSYRCWAIILTVGPMVCVVIASTYGWQPTGASIPPWDHDAFSPLFQISPPISDKCSDFLTIFYNFTFSWKFSWLSSAKIFDNLFF